MKKCLKCSYADWKKTAGGKLHPSGDGKCCFTLKIPVLPACMYWVRDPYPSGGYINRKEELKEHCVYFQIKN